CQNYLTSPLTF
nr:immunoglobulin light chain junction region [Macaca mulatta]